MGYSDKFAKLSEYLTSPEGKARMEDYFERIKSKRAIQSIRFDKFETLLADPAYGQDWFDKLIQRQISYHDDAYRESEYKKGYEPRNSNILQFIIDFAFDRRALLNGDEFCDSFPTDAVFLKGYYFTVTHGQGSFSSVYNYKKELILQV